MYDVIEIMFAEIIESLGLGAWYECEDQWEEIETIILASGVVSEEEVTDFFSTLAWDL